MDYYKMAVEILECMGGIENIQSMSTCTIRLRLVLKDSQKADVEKVRAIDGINDVIIRAGMHQLVIGLNAGKVLAEIRMIHGINK